ncbi:MAG: hypothetical protein ISP88_04545 [Pseudomonadales bacterium]|nr:hypothetical protein [Pseudomonadales bacterium]
MKRFSFLQKLLNIIDDLIADILSTFCCGWVEHNLLAAEISRFASWFGLAVVFLFAGILHPVNSGELTCSTSRCPVVGLRHDFWQIVDGNFY